MLSNTLVEENEKCVCVCFLSSTFHLRGFLGFLPNSERPLILKNEGRGGWNESEKWRRRNRRKLCDRSASSAGRERIYLCVRVQIMEISREKRRQRGPDRSGRWPTFTELPSASQDTLAPFQTACGSERERTRGRINIRTSENNALLTLGNRTSLVLRVEEFDVTYYSALCWN